jgi:hypothetical protein
MVFIWARCGGAGRGRGKKDNGSVPCFGNYPIYSYRDKQIIRFIMWMTRGPTDPNAVIDFTDRNQVEAFGRLVSNMEQAGSGCCCRLSVY